MRIVHNPCTSCLLAMLHGSVDECSYYNFEKLSTWGISEVKCHCVLSNRRELLMIIIYYICILIFNSRLEFWVMIFTFKMFFLTKGNTSFLKVVDLMTLFVYCLHKFLITDKCIVWNKNAFYTLCIVLTCNTTWQHDIYQLNQISEQCTGLLFLWIYLFISKVEL